MIEKLVSSIVEGDLIQAESLFEQIVKEKILNLIKQEQVKIIDESKSQIDLIEALRSKLVVRKGKVKRKWSSTGVSQITIRGNQYNSKVAQINPKTGKKTEAKRSEAQVRAKIFKMKRMWKTTMRAKLPNLLRMRARSMKLANRLDI